MDDHLPNSRLLEAFEQETIEKINEAMNADKKTGDGAGVLIQVPRDFYLIQ